MMTGKVDRLQRSHDEQRDDARVSSAWVRSGPLPTPPSTGLTLFSRGMGATRVTEGEGPVLVMLANEESPALSGLFEQAEAGRRVYVLVPAAWGNGPSRDRLTACPKVLVRRVREVPVSGIHAASGASLWVGSSPAGSAPWCLVLDADQAAWFRRLFLRMFWHDATEEAWTDGKDLTFRRAGKRPFDVPPLPAAAALRLVPMAASLDMDVEADLAHTTAVLALKTTPRRLWLPAGGTHHEDLARLSRGGCEVVWEDHQLPDMMVTAKGGRALAPGVGERLQITLNAGQARDVRSILESPTSWTFGVNLRLGDLPTGEGCIWLSGDATPSQMDPAQLMDLPDVQARALSMAANAEPERWPAPRPLARVIRYRWWVEPPRLPRGAKPDPLVETWASIDQDWQTRHHILAKGLQRTEERQATLGETLRNLAGALLGFARSRSHLEAEQKALSEQLPSAAGPTEATRLFDRLSELERLAANLSADIDDAERKAREKAERERQEEDWKTRIEAAKAELSKLRKALHEAEAKGKEQTQVLEETRAKLKTADNDATKDLKVLEKRQSDEKYKTIKAAKQLANELKSLQSTADEPFQFKPLPSPPALKKQGGPRFVPPTEGASTPAPLPREALPKVGSLCKLQEQRYLKIIAWEEVTLGEQEAERLSARLVAPEAP